MNTNEHSDWKACWAILWRSLLFLPCMFVVFVFVSVVWLSRWMLPLWAALSAYGGDWWKAAVALGVWLLAIWGYRRFRLARFFEPPPSLL